MAGLLNIIGKLFGNKYDKDVKEITPLVEQMAPKENERKQIQKRK